MKIISILITLFLNITLFAQSNQGEILYQEKVNVHKSLPPEMEHRKADIPEFRTIEKVLYFNPEETYYTRLPKEKRKNEEEFRESGRRRGRGMRGGRGGEGKLYTDVKGQQSIESVEFFGKKFLIDGSTKKYTWKITGEQKQVGSYLCQKAEYQDSTEHIIAWFTPMIPLSAGPSKYNGLPGLILHVDINDGDQQITAQNIELKVIEEALIVKPTEGDQISREDFDKLRDEKMEEMKKEFGGREGRGMRGHH